MHLSTLSEWFENLLFGTYQEDEPQKPGNPSHKGADGKVITVIGSGGKTSLIWHLAAYFAAKPGRRILVTPTTKMLVPSKETKLYDFYYGEWNNSDVQNGAVLPEPAPGIILAGHFNEASDKLESLPPDLLEKAISGYDAVLIEGDGSRGLPLKAWTENEPVIPPFTTLTVGMLPLWPLGKPVSEDFVHRLPLFLDLTGAVRGGNLMPEHIVRLITGREAETGDAPIPGLFARAQGRKVLFFNQIEDSESLEQAQKLANHLPQKFRSGLNKIAAGSVRENKITEL